VLTLSERVKRSRVPDAEPSSRIVLET